MVYDMLQVKALFWIPLIQGQTDEERLQIAKETLKKMRQKAVGNGGWNKGIPMSDETKKKLSESKRGTIRNTKKFQITKPDGTTEIIENLSKYCRENNLHNGNMCNVSKGKLNHYKGYRVISL